jgi:hypothetical protein
MSKLGQYKEGPSRGFSPLPSQRGDSQKHIEFNSFRNMNPKFSHRSLFGGPGEDGMEVRANMSNLDVLGPKNEQFLEANIRQHDNKPLNNSDSDLENDIFRTKTLRESECVSQGFGVISNRPPGEDSSLNHNFIIDSGLSELAPIKPPNAYRKITSINYSAYNDNKSNIEQTPETFQRGNMVFKEDLSLNRSNRQLDPRRRMTPKEIFDMKMKQGSRGSTRQIYGNRDNIVNMPTKNFGHRFQGKVVPKHHVGFKPPVSERGIFQKRASPNLTIQNFNPNLLSGMQSRGQFNRNNMFHSSEKSIPVNDELIKKRFEMNSEQVQYKNLREDQINAKKRDFSPFESNEHSRFKKVKNIQNFKTVEMQKTKISRESKEVERKEGGGKVELEEQRKKNENERIKNNMLESIEMIELGQFKRYRKLLAYLISLFVTGNVKEEALDLYTEELQILKIIIYRKFKKHIDIKYLTLPFFYNKSSLGLGYQSGRII